MNSTFGNKDFCSYLYSIYYDYIKTVNGIIGTVLNFICAVIFYKLIRNSTKKDNLNKYLFIKSIFDTLTYVVVIATQTATLSKSDKSYEYQVIYLILYKYILTSFELMSMFLEIASILNRYLAFSRVNKKLESFVFKFLIWIIVAYSFGFYVYRFFDEKIEKSSVNKLNETSYKLTGKRLGGISFILDCIHSTVRDGIFVFLILILNILTLIKLRKVMKNKMLLQSKSIYKDKKLGQTGFRLTKMVVATSSITFFGHILTIISYSGINVINSNNCYTTFRSFTFFSCNSFNFVLYYFFNLNFRRILVSLISHINTFKN